MRYRLDYRTEAQAALKALTAAAQRLVDRLRGRCQAPLRNLPEERVCSLLNSAAQFRLRRKAAHIRNKIESHGRDEALFQELAAALGYKENKLAFTLIAQRLTLKMLRRNAADTEASKSHMGKPN